MEKNTKKLVIHCCGGTGISILDKSMDFFRKRDTDKKAELVIKALDTSDANFNDTMRLKVIDNCLFRIESSSLTNGFLDGSGGVRAHSVDSIVKGVKKYMDSNDYTEAKRGELHIIIASASGGSGNVIATTLLSNMLNKDIPALIILVGDDASAKYCENTIKTLKTVNNIAQKSDKAISLGYFLNNQVNTDRAVSYKRTQENVDISIAAMIDILRMFNGHPKDLDFQDIKNIINPKLKDFNLKNGVYILSYKIGEIVDEDIANIAPVISRTILVNPDEHSPLEIKHNKVGYADDALKSNIGEYYEGKNLNLVLSIGNLKYEISSLEEKEKSIDSKIKEAEKSLDIDSTDDEIVL